MKRLREAKEENDEWPPYNTPKGWEVGEEEYHKEKEREKQGQEQQQVEEEEEEEEAVFPPHPSVCCGFT
jgi:hypothetical protein